MVRVPLNCKVTHQIKYPLETHASLSDVEIFKIVISDDYQAILLDSVAAFM